MGDPFGQLQQAMAEVKTPQGIILSCMHCKKIRNDADAWDGAEDYISQRTDAAFSHGICADCFKEHYGEYLEDDVQGSVPPEEGDTAPSPT